MARRPTDHYLFAHRALMHFTLGGSLSVFGSSIACTALLNPHSATPAIRFLAHLVAKNGEVDMDLVEMDPATVSATVENTPLGEAVSIHSYKIIDASCIIIQMPPPTRGAEAHFVGIILGTDLEKPLVPEDLDRSTPLLYFTLEQAKPHNGVQLTMVGQWRSDGSRRNYGIGPYQDLDSFVDVLERIWVSKIWE